MKTSYKIILIAIVVLIVVFAAYQTFMYQCGTIPVYAETPRTPTFWKCMNSYFTS